MIVLGIDPGLVKTGYGLIEVMNDNCKILDFGVITPNKTDTLSNRLNTIYTDILLIIDKFRPNIVSIEEVFFGKNAKSALLLGHARGASMLSASNKKIPVFEYSPRKIKQSVTGNGNAHKSQVKYMVMKQFNIKVLDCPEDATDALAIALCHLNQIKIKEL